MQPTVGRIVHFHPAISGTRPADYQPNAAVVTRVNANGTLNLHVFHSGRGGSPNGVATDIPLGDPADPKFRGGRFASWPPRESAIEEGSTAFVSGPAVDESAGGDAGDAGENSDETVDPDGGSSEPVAAVDPNDGSIAAINPVRQTSEN